MGGQGSGRRPNAENLIRQQEDFAPVIESDIIGTLPNYSGVKTEALKTSGDSLLTTETDPIFIANSGSYLTAETDPIFIANSGSYLTAESDPVFLSLSGSIPLNQIANPTGDKDFNMTTRQIGFTWANPAGAPMTLTAAGAYSDSVLRVEQNTGNPGAGTYLATFESSDTDVEHIRSIVPSTNIHAYCGYVTGDSSERFVIHGDGKLEWGDGTSQDVALYRDAAESLYSDGSLECSGSVSGSSVYVGTNPVLTSYTETDPIWIANSGSYLKTADIATYEQDPVFIANSGSYLTAESDPIWLAQSGSYSLIADDVWVAQSGSYSTTATALADDVWTSQSGSYITDLASGSAHFADSSDPHGATLTQTNMTCSGNISGGTTLEIWPGDKSYSGSATIVPVIYNDSDGTPAANTTPIGTLYVQYTA